MSYAPSVTVLGDLTERIARTRQAPPGKPFLGIGLTDADSCDGLPPLPGAREVREIAEVYGTGARVVTGPEATKELILKETAGRCRSESRSHD